MEKYVASHISKYVESNNLLTESQFGFRKGHSTVHPLMMVHQLSADVLDKSQELVVLALDIAGAFDTVWHKRLVQKCESFGIRGQILSMLKSYLSDRKQLTSVGGSFSPARPVRAGVPQGSILGPLLFLLYINDLPDVVNSQCLLFADDCSLVKRIPTAGSRTRAFEMLQSDLDSILKWAEMNQLRFAAHKTQAMVISRKRDSATLSELPLSMNGVDVAREASLKILGMTFSSDGLVKNHIISKAATAGKLLGMLRRQSSFLSQEARYRVYAATIRPVIEYGCTVFANAPSTCLSLLDQLQRRASRLFPDLSHKLDPLDLRRDVASLCQLYRIVDGSAPSALRKAINPKFLSVNRATRNTEAMNLRALDIPKSRTSLHQLSFLPRTSRRWNHLTGETAFAPTMSAFKRRCAVELRTMHR